VLEGVDARPTTFGISSNTFSPHQVTRHVEGIVAAGLGRLVVPHLDGFQQRLLRPGRQKSITIVVPPESAATVPLSKSAAE
jgi:hypothetical protein